MGASRYKSVRVQKIKKDTGKAFLIKVDGYDYWVPSCFVADADDYEEGMVNATMSIDEKIVDEKEIPYED